MHKILFLILSFISIQTFAQDDNGLCDEDKARCRCNTNTHDFYVIDETEFKCLPKCLNGLVRNTENFSCIPACRESYIRNEMGICTHCDTNANDIVDDQCLPKCQYGKERVGEECKKNCGVGKERNDEGICEKIAECKKNETRLEDGICRKQCPPGQVANDSGKCLQGCPFGQERVKGKCQTICREGMERAPNGFCMPACTEGYKRNDKGVCEYCGADAPSIQIQKSSSKNR